jgi:STAM-binding protein
VAVQQELKLLDQLRPRINERHERFQTILEAREASKLSTVDNTGSDHDNIHVQRRQLRQVNAHDHTDFAARLAHREHSRRVAASQQEASARHPAGDDLQRRIQAIRARVDDQQLSSTAQRPVQDRHDPTYQYPTVPSNKTRTTPGSATAQTERPHDVTGPTIPPALPPKPGYSSQIPTLRPSVPEKIPQHVPEPPVRSDTPTDDRMFAATAHLENGTALRTIFLPSTLRTTFLRIAHKNTVANLETCGFLAGTLMKNAFFVSKLIVPSQTATSDTCEMTNESELFDYVDASDLMILGWVHTHPSQTCFMSSRDLHTHSGYQMMLAESVAIVCAPSKGDTSHGGDYGVFRLTDPPGKKVILNCQKPGVFHPHDVDNVYTDALRPGHVVEVRDMPFDVVDLRS